MATVRCTYTQLGNSLSLQPAPNTERRATIMYKERAADAVAQQLRAYAVGLRHNIFSIGPDNRLWWTDPGHKPTDMDRQLLEDIMVAYEIQVG